MSETNEKIPEEKLREFATNDSSDVVSVIVEVDLPAPTVDYEKTESKGFRPVRIAPRSADSPAQKERIMEQAGSVLTQIGQPPPLAVRRAEVRPL